MQIEKLELRLIRCGSSEQIREHVVVAHPGSGDGGGPLSEPFDDSVFGLQQAGSTEQQRGFATASGAYHGERPADIEVQVNSSKDIRRRETRAGPCAKALSDTSKLESAGHADR